MNGYDEEKEEIEAFVKEKSLKQTILLNGRSVASDLYGAEEFPAGFWIDRDGRVVHRELGFEEDRVPRMERRIERLLLLGGARRPGGR